MKDEQKKLDLLPYYCHHHSSKYINKKQYIQFLPFVSLHFNDNMGFFYPQNLSTPSISNNTAIRNHLILSFVAVSIVLLNVIPIPATEVDSQRILSKLLKPPSSKNNSSIGNTNRNTTTTTTTSASFKGRELASGYEEDDKYETPGMKSKLNSILKSSDYYRYKWPKYEEYGQARRNSFIPEDFTEQPGTNDSFVIHRTVDFGCVVQWMF